MGTPVGTDPTCVTAKVVVPSQRVTVPVTSSTGPAQRVAGAGEDPRPQQELHVLALVLDRHEDRAGLAAGMLAGDGPARHPQHRPVGRLRHSGGRAGRQRAAWAARTPSGARGG